MIWFNQCYFRDGIKDGQRLLGECLSHIEFIVRQLNFQTFIDMYFCMFLLFFAPLFKQSVSV